MVFYFIFLFPTGPGTPSSKNGTKVLVVIHLRVRAADIVNNSGIFLFPLGPGTPSSKSGTKVLVVLAYTSKVHSIE